MTPPEFDLLPDQVAADALASRAQILAAFDLGVQAGTAYDSGTAYNAMAGYAHARFLELLFERVSHGVLPDPADALAAINSAQQLQAWHLLDLHQVNVDYLASHQ